MCSARGSVPTLPRGAHVWPFVGDCGGPGRLRQRSRHLSAPRDGGLCVNFPMNSASGAKARSQSRDIFRLTACGCAKRDSNRSRAGTPSSVPHPTSVQTTTLFAKSAGLTAAASSREKQHESQCLIGLLRPGLRRPSRRLDPTNHRCRDGGRFRWSELVVLEVERTPSKPLANPSGSPCPFSATCFRCIADTSTYRPRPSVKRST